MIRSLNFHRAAAVGIALILGFPFASLAQTWTGAASGLWSVGGNWLSNPNPPVSNPATVLTFGASPVTNLAQDIAGPFQLNRINFTAAAVAYSMIGNTLDFRTNVATTPRIDFATVSNVGLLIPLTLTNNFSVTGSGLGILTLSGQVSGAGSLSTSKAGILRLSSGANNFTGGVFVNSESTLELTNGTAIPAGTAVTVNDGQFNIGSVSNAAASAIGTLTLNSGGVFRVPTGSGDYHLNRLDMGGGGLGGTVDFTGTTAFDLHFAGAGAGITASENSTWIGGGSSRIVNDGATLPITLSSNAVITSGINLAFGNAGSGFRVTGQGTLSLLNSSGNTADFTVDGAQARLGVTNMTALGTGALFLTNQGRLDYDGATATSAKQIALLVGGGRIGVQQAGTNLTLTGQIGQAGLAQLEVSGPGALTLEGANNYTGPTVILPGGTVSVATITNGGVAGPLGASSNAPANLVLGSGTSSAAGTLRYTGSTVATNRGFTVTSADGGGTIEITNAATSLTVTGQVVGSGRLTKTGPGTLRLSPVVNNPFSGGTFVNQGTLQVGSNFAVIPQGGNVTVAAGAVFDTNGHDNGVANAIGTVALNGGTLGVGTGSGIYFMNRLVTGASGGTVAITNPSTYLFGLTGAGAGVAVNGNSTWTQAFSTSGLSNDTGAEIDLTIAPGVTLTSSVQLNNGTSGKGFRITGGGTFEQDVRSSTADLTIGPARYRVSSLPLLTGGDMTFDGGTLEYTGGSTTMIKAFDLAGGGGAIDIVNAGTTLTLTSTVTGLGRLRKAGPGVLILNNLSNSYQGGIEVNAGRLDVAADNQLGVANPTVNALGTLRYTASATSARTFNLIDGGLEVPAGVTLTLNGAQVGGGFLRGAGTFALTGATTLAGATTFTSTTMNVIGAASATNFSNNAALTVNSGQTFAMNFATNGAAGRMTVNGTANVNDFVSYGQLTVPNGGLINNTGSNMVLGGGSTTFVGAVGNLGGKIDLGGQQLHVRGGLLVTNSGSFASGNGVRNGTTIADYGALVKGTGPYQSVITQNGGQYLPGNSPGTSQVGDFFINPGGNLIFQITDAGPSLSFPGAPGIAGSNPGWGLTQVFTSMNFTATPASPYTITMQTQLPPPAAPDTPGPMSSFDPNRAYQWLIFDLQPGAVFNGTFDPNAINFATAAFVNPTVGGTFSLARTGGQIFLTFTPVPEPGLVLTAAAVGLSGVGLWRRRVKR